MLYIFCELVYNMQQTLQGTILWNYQKELSTYLKTTLR